MANCSLLVRLSALCFFVLASAFTLPHPVTRRGATTCSASEGSSSTTGKELKKFASIAISAAALLLAQPAPSDASYGSGGAAVFSFPQVKSLSVDEFLKLPDAKKKQRQFTISCSADDKACQRNVDRLLQEFKLNIKDIKAEQQKEAQLDQMASEVSQRVSQKQKELDQSLGLEVQLQERSDMLNKLAAQPAWVSYGAAAAGSVVSTLIMHPLDTLKIRLITKKDKEGEEEEPIDIKSLYKGIGANIAKEVGAVHIIHHSYTSHSHFTFTHQIHTSNSHLTFTLNLPYLVPNTTHHTPHTKSHTPHPTPHTTNPEPRTLHHTPQPITHNSQPTTHNPHPTHHTSNPTPHTPQPTPHIPHPTTHNP